MVSLDDSSMSQPSKDQHTPRRHAPPPHYTPVSSPSSYVFSSSFLNAAHALEDDTFAAQTFDSPVASPSASRSPAAGPSFAVSQPAQVPVFTMAPARGPFADYLDRVFTIPSGKVGFRRNTFLPDDFLYDVHSLYDYPKAETRKTRTEAAVNEMANIVSFSPREI